jgi:predicted ribosome quality control (RQC) complex YloA/Tae2 family protein
MASATSIQAMDVTTLRAVLAELRPLLLPSRFEKAQQTDGDCIDLALRTLGGIHWLALAWQAEAPRLLAIPAPPRRGEGSTLARQLQHSLRGLALVGIAQHGWERVVELRFARRPGEPAERSLVLETMGRHSNLFLLDGRRRVVALARQVRPDQSRRRPIGTADPYRPPPAMEGEAPSPGEPEADWQRRLSLLPIPLGQALRQAYQGIGPALARQLCAGAAAGGADADGGGGDGASGEGATLLDRNVRELTPLQWNRLWRRWCAWLGTCEQGSFTLAWGGPSDYRCWDGPPLPAGHDPLAINHGLARYYAERLARRTLVRRHRALHQRLELAMEREHREVDRQQALLAAIPEAEDLSRRADALLCEPRPSREQVEEAQALYRRARKLRRSRQAILPRLALHQDRCRWLEASLTYLEQAETPQQLEDLEEECGEFSSRSGGGGARRTTAARTTACPLELQTSSGLRLQVGRNHRQNESISLRQARRGDLWFHAQECPGSHVVLKASEGTPAEADLASAADLAAHFSRGKGNRRVPVVMVPTDDLQRIPGAGPGTVRHRGGTILWGEPERALALLPPSLEAPARP